MQGVETVVLQVYDGKIEREIDRERERGRERGHLLHYLLILPIDVHNAKLLKNTQS